MTQLVLTTSLDRPPADAARFRLMGMPVDRVDEAAALAHIATRLSRGEGTWVLTPNLDILRQYRQAETLRPLFHVEQGGADLLIADGMPLVWASQLAGKPLPGRVPGSGLVLSLARLAAQKGWSLFLLGGSPGAADRAAAVLQWRFPGLKIAGTLCPPAGFEKDPAQVEEIREKVRAANPDIVYVALGFPKQELMIQRLREVLPRAAFLGVGISLSFIAGEVKRAPAWIQRLGLEWVHRLMQEPRRLARRYLVHDAPFAILRLFPAALMQRWRIDDNEDEPPVQAPSAPPGPPAAARRPALIRNPSEGTTDEGRHSRRRPGHTPEPPDQGHQQAPASRLRQADGALPDRMSA